MKHNTFKYSDEEIKNCYGHLVIWHLAALLRTWCIVVTITFHIDVAGLHIFRDNVKIIHGQLDVA